MARIILDACVPQFLRHEFEGHEVETAHFAGLDDLPDGQLLDAIEGQYDILITLDRNLTDQQKIAHRPFAVIVLEVASQTPEDFRALVPAIHQAINKASAGRVIEACAG